MKPLPNVRGFKHQTGNKLEGMCVVNQCVWCPIASFRIFSPMIVEKMRKKIPITRRYNFWIYIPMISPMPASGCKRKAGPVMIRKMLDRMRMHPTMIKAKRNVFMFNSNLSSVQANRNYHEISSFQKDNVFLL
jgi:hypothetical protein